MCVGLVAQTALCVKLLVLNHQRQVGHTELQIKCFGQFSLVVVFHQKETGQTVVRLLCGQRVRMRVVPIRATTVAHGEVVVITRTRGDRIHRMAVHTGGRVQAVPVDDGGFGQSVVQGGGEAAATFNAQDGVLKRFARVLGLVQQEWRLLCGQQGEAGCRGAYLQRARNIEHTKRPAGHWDEQLLLKVFRRNWVKGIRAKWCGCHICGMARTVINPGRPAGSSHGCDTGQLK